MKRTSNEKPYISMCLVVRNCEDTLEAALSSARKRIPDAEIVVVDTCSSDGTHEIAQKYADVFEVYRGPRGDWDEAMLAVDDMCAARTRSFELASGRWRGWMDADDRLPDPDEARELLKLNGYVDPARKYQSVEEHTPDGDDGLIGLDGFFRMLEEKYPNATMVWCPYLYQRDENNIAMIWQDRERFVRCDDDDWSKSMFNWAEAAHELLVPKPGYRPPRVDLAHFLYVHEKKWDDNAYDYSTVRHFNILIKQYESGEITSRRCRYLSAYAQQLCPERELEFLEAGHRMASTKLDRAFALIHLGQYYVSRGLYRDACEKFGAAQTLCPTVPDVWYAGGCAAAKMNDHATAARWLNHGYQCEMVPGSEITPRNHKVYFPTILGIELDKLADDQIKNHMHANAERTLERAVEVTKEVKDFDGIGPDSIEAVGRWLMAKNKFEGHLHAIRISQLWDYLVRNDETEKAMKVLDSVPHNIVDHPLMVEIHVWAHQIKKHMEDTNSYIEHYNDDDATGWCPAPNHFLEPDMEPQPRMEWIANFIRNINPNARVLDYACCDGIIGIPLMKLCPSIEYVGADISKSAIREFIRHMEEHGMETSPHLVELTLDHGVDLEECLETGSGGKFDFVIFTEIIEHVPDPKKALLEVIDYLKDDGILFLSTPDGAYDSGEPPKETLRNRERGHLGHLRVYTVSELTRLVQDLGLCVESIYTAGDDKARGKTMHATITKAKLTDSKVAFAVPGALWDWNGRTVHHEGMGASEECIVYLAEHLSAHGRKCNVYGPVPREEVCGRVGYFPRAQLRHLREDDKIVVSRGPNYYMEIDALLGRHQDKVLWLQDAVYPELDERLANRYTDIVVVSNWHKQAMHERHGVPLDKMTVAYNFLLAEHFTGDKPERKRDHFIYASSPDRGLIRLLRLWPRILARYPEATLAVFYGWRGCETLGGSDHWNHRFESMRKMYEELKHQKGIQEFGMVNHVRLAQEYRRAGIWGYHTDFEETGCLSACKARAAGAVPVTSALAALNETANCPQATLIDLDADDYDDQFLEGVRKAIEITDAERDRMSEEAIETYRVEAIAPIWRRLLG